MQIPTRPPINNYFSFVPPTREKSPLDPTPFCGRFSLNVLSKIERRWWCSFVGGTAWPGTMLCPTTHTQQRNGKPPTDAAPLLLFSRPPPAATAAVLFVLPRTLWQSCSRCLTDGTDAEWTCDAANAAFQNLAAGSSRVSNSKIVEVDDASGEKRLN